MLGPQQLCRGCGRVLGSAAPPRICSNTATWSLKPGNLQPVSRVSSVRPDLKTAKHKAMSVASHSHGEVGWSREGSLGSSELFSPCTRCTWIGPSSPAAWSDLEGQGDPRGPAGRSLGRRTGGGSSPSSALGHHCPFLGLTPHTKNQPPRAQTCPISSATPSITTSWKSPSLSPLSPACHPAPSLGPQSRELK